MGVDSAHTDRQHGFDTDLLVNSGIDAGINENRQPTSAEVFDQLRAELVILLNDDFVIPGVALGQPLGQHKADAIITSASITPSDYPNRIVHNNAPA
jgi:hypothetical protein